MKCPTCATELPPGESFCRECGQQIITPAATIPETDPTLHLPQPRANPAAQAAAPRTYPVGRITGIVILFFGLLLLAGNLRFGVPTGKGLGILGILLGGTLIGLSFVPNPQPAAGAQPPPLSTADTLTRIFYEPEPVFKSLKQRPRWLAALLVVALVGAVYQFAVVQRLGPERIADDMATRIIDGGFLQGAPISPDDFRQMQIAQALKTATADKIFQPVGAVMGTAIFMLLVGALYLLGVLAFGGRMNFWQAVSVAVYSALPPAVILTLLNLILLYTQSVDDIIPIKAQQQNLARADLGLLFSPASHPGLYTFASFIGLFSIYRLWLAAAGLRNAADKIKSGSAWAIVLILWLIGALVLSVFALFFPSFIA
ncbi:MAG TPA: YIP1 family protein [Pyrinomonadaceae bacterium]|jgi:hypothetical protein